MILIDSHCHLELKHFPDIDAVVARAQAAGVKHAVVVGLMQEPGDFGRSLELARLMPSFFTSTCGIHPHDVAKAQSADWESIAKICAMADVVAVGETGLDYFYDHSPRDVQREGFRRQCQLAKSVRKPLVVHVRDAHEECADILAAEGVSSGMIHCFTGDRVAAERYLSLGFSLSISGVVTYKKNEALQEAVAMTPIDRLMVETDSPYLTPVPFRGKFPNEPAMVAETAKKIAELKGQNADAVALACAHNVKKMLRLNVTLPDISQAPVG